MSAIKNDVRYEILAEQFSFPSDKVIYCTKEIKNSLGRIFSFMFNFSDVYYLENIDEKLLYNYIKYHGKVDFNNVSLVEVLRDVKNFFYFLKIIKGHRDVPEINLSINNFYLWSQL